MRFHSDERSRLAAFMGLTLALTLGACSQATMPMADETTGSEQAAMPAGEGDRGRGSRAANDNGGNRTSTGGDETHDGHGDRGQDESARGERLALHMGTYFWKVLEARDALIAGGLDRAKSRMRQLSEQEYRSLVPDSWLADMQRVAQEAARVAEADDLREASEAIGRLAVACGTCHAEHHGGPLPGGGSFRKPKEGGEDLPARMLRHQWAAARPWTPLPPKRVPRSTPTCCRAARAATARSAPRDSTRLAIEA